MRDKTVFKLRLITFFQYVVICGVIPVMSLYLRGIPGITGTMAGIILSMSTVAGIASPLITVYVADRFIRPERLFALCNIAASFLMLLLRFQTDFLPLAVLYLLIMLFLTPSSALINIMVFNFLDREGKRFGAIRVWGTFGWIFMSVFFSYIWLGDYFFKSIEKSIGDILYFSSGTALLLGLYSLTLDSGKKTAADRPAAAGLSSFCSNLAAADRKRLLVFFTVSFFIAIVDKYYYLGISPYLKHSGIPDKWIMPLLSAGNISEIILMFLLFRIISRYSFRKTLAAGAVFELIRFILFAFPANHLLLVSGILIHGATFALYSACAFIYLDMFCSEKGRTANHLVYSFVISGGSSLAGNLTGGIMLDFSISVFRNYTVFWIVPAFISLLSMIMIIGFIDDAKPVFQIEG